MTKEELEKNVSESYELDSNVVNFRVAEGRLGVYILGQTAETWSDFYVQRVGRSDEDLNERLRQHAREKKYPEFMFMYCGSLKENFDWECFLYHEFDPKLLHNVYHPDRPDGEDWPCPRCTKFD
ncbi:MAG: hypothetical protein F4X56_01165 [Gammaproteobacteria bacterium]|nr:hypothetical protein [Gammaproteobacteria bacterium]